MNDPGQGIGFVCGGHIPGRIAPGERAHVAVDGHSLLGVQMHQTLGDVHRLGTVAAEDELFVDRIDRHLFCAIVCTAGAPFSVIEIHLAQIMEKGGNGEMFFAQIQTESLCSYFGKTEYIQGMLAQTAFISTVVTCTGRRIEEIAVIQPLQQIL